MRPDSRVMESSAEEDEQALDGLDIDNRLMQRRDNRPPAVSVNTCKEFIYLE